MQSRPRAVKDRHPRQRHGQQRGRYGAETASVLAQARAAMLVGRGRLGQCRGRRGHVEGVDSEGVDVRDERYRTTLTHETYELFDSMVFVGAVLSDALFQSGVLCMLRSRRVGSQTRLL